MTEENRKQMEKYRNGKKEVQFEVHSDEERKEILRQFGIKPDHSMLFSTPTLVAIVLVIISVAAMAGILTGSIQIDGLNF